jgi:LmbE family N-acetylglucosaminyl deacetylase
MSTRYNNGSHYENHQRAAELHDVAAHAHNAAAGHQGHQDHLTAHELSRQAAEHSRLAWVRTQRLAGNVTPAVSQRQATEARAHALWVARGCPEGSAEIDWLTAESQLVR